MDKKQQRLQEIFGDEELEEIDPDTPSRARDLAQISGNEFQSQGPGATEIAVASGGQLANAVVQNPLSTAAAAYGAYKAPSIIRSGSRLLDRIAGPGQPPTRADSPIRAVAPTQSTGTGPARQIPVTGPQGSPAPAPQTAAPTPSSTAVNAQSVRQMAMDRLRSLAPMAPQASRAATGIGALMYSPGLNTNEDQLLERYRAIARQQGMMR
jgi:hypothetical protein